MLNNFVSSKLGDVLFGEGCLTKRDRKGHGEMGGKKCPFLGDVLNGCSLSTRTMLRRPQVLCIVHIFVVQQQAYYMVII